MARETSEEGRLTPAELDRVLGGQTPSRVPPEPEPVHDGDPLPGELSSEELTVGDDGPTWGARIGGTVRAHKRLTAATVASLLVLGALTAGYVRTRPPPLATRIDATAQFLPDLSDAPGATITDGILRAKMRLQGSAGATAVTAVSFAGPGLGPGTLTQQRSIVTVTNPLDCNTIGGFSAPPVPAVLQIAQPDAWGRTVSGAIAVRDDPGVANIPASGVGDAIRQACVGRFADALQITSARTISSPAAEVVTLSVHNPTRWDLIVVGANAVFQPSDATLGTAGNALPAGSTTLVDLPVARTDCGVGLGGQRGDATQSDPGRRVGNFVLGISPSGAPDPRYDNYTNVPLTARQRRVVVSGLAAPCAGAPHFTYTPMAVHVIPGGIAFQLLFTTSAGTISLGPSSPPSQLGWSFSSADLAEHGHRAVATIQLLGISCSIPTDQLSPPEVDVLLSVVSRAYPVRTIANTREVLEALGHACHQVPDLAAAHESAWNV